MHSEVRQYTRVETEHGATIIDTTDYTDVDFKKLFLRFFYDTMKRLEVPRPRISKLYTHWFPA